MKAIIALLLILAATSTNAFSVEDRNCLALNIYFEARSETPEGQIAVAHATLNRVANRYYPNNICDVIREPAQFSWFWDGKSDKPKEADAWNYAQALADIAIRWYTVGEDFSEGATHYHASYVTPYWAHKLERVKQVGKHIFYQENRNANH